VSAGFGILAGGAGQNSEGLTVYSSASGPVLSPRLSRSMP
jgi:hypothetical protein